MEGVLPYIYKYTSVLLNLTNFEIKQRGINPYSTNEKKEVDVNDLMHNLQIARDLYSLYKEYNTSLTTLIDRNVVNTLFDSHDNRGLNLMEDTEDGELKGSTKNTARKADLKGMKKSDLLTEKLTTLCSKMIKDIEKFYEGSKFKPAIRQFKHMD